MTCTHQFTNDPKFDRPYRSEDGLATLKFGKRMESYSVPIRLIEGVPELEARQDFEMDPIIWLTEIDEDVGHTLVHYLYTGEYQTLRKSKHKRHTEYKRSVLVYCAASNLEMVGLGDMALGHMEHFANSVDIYQILNMAKMVYSKMPCWDVWYYDHIETRLEAAFHADESIFEKPEFLNCFGGDRELDKVMVETMVSLYGKKTSISERGDGIQCVPEQSLREVSPAMEGRLAQCSISPASTPVGSEPYVKLEPVVSPAVLEVDCFGQTGGGSLKRSGSFSDDSRKKRKVNGISGEF